MATPMNVRKRVVHPRGRTGDSDSSVRVAVRCRPLPVEEAASAVWVEKEDDSWQLHLSHPASEDSRERHVFEVDRAFDAQCSQVESSSRGR